jgi:phosphatidate phosphatase APP1
MNKVVDHKKAAVKVYHGYGHQHDLIVFGHVLKSLPAERRHYSNNILANIWHLLKLFFIKPLAGVRVQLIWRNGILESETEKDGFFKFEWQSVDEVSAGWHELKINCVNNSGNIIGTGDGKVFVPNSTQYGFISDIDDTVLISHSSTKFRRLRTLMTKNPHQRKPFNDVVKHYDLLAYAHTESTVPNPFYYVSSSEWNLYDDLNEFFKHNKIPKGVFLLNQIKRWYQFWKTGNTKHEGKMLRIMRILTTFPKQKFILLGDNSQADPSIYSSIASRYPGTIYAIYIHNVVQRHEAAAKKILSEAEKQGVFCCVYKDHHTAIEHSRAIGLIT